MYELEYMILFFRLQNTHAEVLKRCWRHRVFQKKRSRICILLGTGKPLWLKEMWLSIFLSLSSQTVSQMLMAYLSRLSAIADNKINCGPALTWMEVLLSLPLFSFFQTLHLRSSWLSSPFSQHLSSTHLCLPSLLSTLAFFSTFCTLSFCVIFSLSVILFLLSSSFLTLPHDWTHKSKGMELKG